jgi:cutinase
MRRRSLAECFRLAAAAVALATALATAIAPFGAAPLAHADGCPDVELVFARGTGEPPGPGRVGQALADTLAPMLGGRSLAVYGVNYPASINFLTTSAGAIDTENHLAAVATACPATRFILGGFSQGAAVMSMLAGVAPLGTLVGNLGSAPPMPPEAADQISAVAVFGNPAGAIPGGGSLTTLSSRYGAKTIDLCVPDDIYCWPGGRSFPAHLAYASNGMVGQAADFVAARLQ